MNDLIGEAVRTTERIRQFVAGIPSTAPLSIKQIAQRLGDQISGEHQVINVVNYMYHGQGTASRIREGREYKYWGKVKTTAPVVKTDTEEIKVEAISPVSEPLLKADQDRLVPEIRVEKDKIVIEHALCRIVVELKK